jgi:protein required for attachment to host cells
MLLRAIWARKHGERDMKRLNHNARVLVTDGGRAQVYRNAGDVGRPRLEEVRTYAHDNPPSRELGTDKPSRVQESATPRRSAAELTDYHQQAEDRFVAGIAADMDADLKSGGFTELVVVAPPVALGVYRKAASPALQKATLMEINKDLTRHTVPEIAAIVVKALEGE